LDPSSILGASTNLFSGYFLDRNLPIGIFDSGVGGLPVVVTLIVPELPLGPPAL